MPASHRRKGNKSRSSERGAALITSLMIATLVLAAGGALILSTSTSATTSIDATAEMQAYYGAEAGLQQVLNVLRGNVNPHNITANTKINFRNAVTRNLTNANTDPTAAPLRFSGWLVYNYTSTGSAYPDRIKVSPTDNTYSPLTGIAFSVSVSDPDNTPTTAGDPPRLVIQSIGYGPKGSMKRLEMVVHRNYFNFTPPAAITLAGGTGMTLNLGTSNASGYTGNDISVPPLAGIATVAVSPVNEAQGQTAVDNLNSQGGGTQVTPSDVAALNASNTPDFLTDAATARQFLTTAKEIADTNHRLFPNQGSVTGGLGAPNACLTTVIDNFGGAAVDLGAGYQGCGLLIVTGPLITHGQTDFSGLILVLGNGTFNRNGNGNGHIDGGIIVASFDPDPSATSTAFNNPVFSVNGGGNSDVRYDSEAIRKAFDSAGVFVAGIHEY